MSENRLHWRIAFSMNEFYYIVASSDVKSNDLVNSWASLSGGYSTKNGMASILSRSPQAKIENIVPHIFVKNGDAFSAMNEMIKQLEKVYGRQCIKPIVKL